MFTIQYDGVGRFRIAQRMGSSEHFSAWTDYDQLATLQVEDKVYVAGTGYGLLPRSEQVYQLTPQYTMWKEADATVGEEYPTSPVLSLVQRKAR
jgi:hypothetical protein